MDRIRHNMWLHCHWISKAVYSRQCSIETKLLSFAESQPVHVKLYSSERADLGSQGPISDSEQWYYLLSSTVPFCLCLGRAGNSKQKPNLYLYSELLCLRPFYFLFFHKTLDTFFADDPWSDWQKHLKACWETSKHTRVNLHSEMTSSMTLRLPYALWYI